MFSNGVAARVWLSTLIGGLALMGVGAYDAFLNHAVTFGVTGDLTTIYLGFSVIIGKSIFDLGVAVPNPPK